MAQQTSVESIPPLRSAPILTSEISRSRTDSQLGGECWYVIRAGIAQADEIPDECGVLIATDSAFEVARPAPKRAMRLPFDAWMALARATPLAGWRLEDSQGLLGDTRAPPSPTAP